VSRPFTIGEAELGHESVVLVVLVVVVVVVDVRVPETGPLPPSHVVVPVKEFPSAEAVPATVRLAQAELPEPLTVKSPVLVLMAPARVTVPMASHGPVTERLLPLCAISKVQVPYGCDTLQVPEISTAAKAGAVKERTTRARPIIRIVVLPPLSRSPSRSVGRLGSGLESLGDVD